MIYESRLMRSDDGHKEFTAYTHLNKRKEYFYTTTKITERIQMMIDRLGNK